jgi:uncharacterized protein (TIGR03435 family)
MHLSTRFRHSWLTLLGAVVSAQAIPGLVEFSVKPSRENKNNIDRTATQLIGRGLTLRRAISLAYQVPESRVSGPAYLADEAFDMTMRWDQASAGQMPALLQQALISRFHLASHVEEKTMRT